jgi:hypothetical protein
VELKRDGSRTWRVHRLSDGQFISEYDANRIIKDPLPDTQGLPFASHRYQIGLDWGPLIADYETGKSYRLTTGKIDQNDTLWMNRAGTYCVHVKAFPPLNLLPLNRFSAALAWIAEWKEFPWYSRAWNYHRVVSVPDLREIYHALQPTRVAGISTSGRWLAVALPVSLREKRQANEPASNYFIRFIDLKNGHTFESADSVKVAILEIAFLQDEIMGLTLETPGPNLPALMHAPSGKLIAEFSILGHGLFNYYGSVTTEFQPPGYSYFKIEDQNKTSKTISAHFIDQNGTSSEIGRHTFPRIVDQSNCRGGQLYYYGDQASDWPSWLESKLGKDSFFFRLFLSFYYRRYNAVYDWRSDTDVMKWSGRYSGSPSFDGSMLVMCEHAEDVYLSGGVDDLRRINVYDLPLSVYSRWWSRSAGLLSFLVVCLLLCKVDRKQ